MQSLYLCPHFDTTPVDIPPCDLVQPDLLPPHSTLKQIKKQNDMHNLTSALTLEAHHSDIFRSSTFPIPFLPKPIPPCPSTPTGLGSRRLVLSSQMHPQLALPPAPSWEYELPTGHRKPPIAEIIHPRSRLSNTEKSSQRG